MLPRRSRRLPRARHSGQMLAAGVPPGPGQLARNLSPAARQAPRAQRGHRAAAGIPVGPGHVATRENGGAWHGMMGLEGEEHTTRHGPAIMRASFRTRQHRG